jgi:hypothetical protein
VPVVLEQADSVPVGRVVLVAAPASVARDLVVLEVQAQAA